MRTHDPHHIKGFIYVTAKDICGPTYDPPPNRTPNLTMDLRPIFLRSRSPSDSCRPGPRDPRRQRGSHLPTTRTMWGGRSAVTPDTSGVHTSRPSCETGFQKPDKGHAFGWVGGGSSSWVQTSLRSSVTQTSRRRCPVHSRSLVTHTAGGQTGRVFSSTVEGTFPGPRSPDVTRGGGGGTMGRAPFPPDVRGVGWDREVTTPTVGQGPNVSRRDLGTPVKTETPRRSPVRTVPSYLHRRRLTSGTPPWEPVPADTDSQVLEHRSVSSGHRGHGTSGPSWSLGVS